MAESTTIDNSAPIPSSERRTPIASQARVIKEGRKYAEVIDDLPSIFDYGTPEMLEQWKKFKPEIYAITSVIIDRVIRRALEAKSQHPPFGLTKKSKSSEHETVSEFQGDQPFKSLRDAMSDTLIRHSFDEQKDLKSKLKDSGNTEPIKKTYQRLLDILPAKTPTADSELGKDSIIYFMQETGINTATKVMANLLEVIPNLHKRDVGETPTADVFAQIATNSYPLLAKLAMMHLRNFAAIEKHIASAEGKSKWDLGKFKLVQSANGLRVEVGQELQKIIDEFDNEAFESTSDMVGCPAMVNFGDGTAVKKLWEWNIDVGKTIYEKTIA